MIKNLLSVFPPVIQYVIVLGLIMILLYVCLILTRLLGQNHGDKISYDDPEQYDKTVPDPANVNWFKKKKEPKDDENGDCR